MPESSLVRRLLLPELHLTNSSYAPSCSRTHLEVEKVSPFEVCPRCAQPLRSVYDRRKVVVKEDAYWTRARASLPERRSATTGQRSPSPYLLSLLRGARRATSARRGGVAGRAEPRPEGDLAIARGSEPRPRPTAWPTKKMMLASGSRAPSFASSRGRSPRAASKSGVTRPEGGVTWTRCANLRRRTSPACVTALTIWSASWRSLLSGRAAIPTMRHA